MRKIAAVIAAMLAFAFVLLSPVAIHAVVSRQTQHHHYNHVIPRIRGSDNSVILALSPPVMTIQHFLLLRRAPVRAVPFHRRL